CVAQAEGQEVIRRAPHVDIVVGPQSYQELPNLLSTINRTNKHAVKLDFPMEAKFDKLPIANNNQRHSAFVTIQEGCDKFCTFCCVPYTRGAEFSRPVADIIREAMHLTKNSNVSEITLLGQNVNAYHGLDLDLNEEIDLAYLIDKLSNITRLKRIRYTTSHPRDMSSSLIQAHGKYKQLMPYLHLPVQSGSNKILKAMNRKHTAQEYLNIIKQLKTERPDIAFSSDFIVGFPGETDDDFAQTMHLVEQVKYAQCYSFKYSPRPGTTASTMKLVDEKTQNLRLAKLQAILKQQQDQFNQSMVGTTTEVLFDKKGKHQGQIAGKTPYMQTVNVVANDSLLGSIAPVTITQLLGNSFAGKLI
ncbi:MAG: tRNA (N6-isopentenyl adenosine(37)-C2)-methylthiotransferase MiaB, partial [Pseudomonadota bacterium]